VGPTLANFGVTGVLANPALSLVTSKGATVGTNDDWNSSLAGIMNAVGAFPLNAGSRDAALQVAVPTGVYSALVSGASGTGAAMVEVYDSEDSAAGGARLTNLSARALLSPNETMIAGFVIAGDQRKAVLIRAIGPTLSGFGVANAYADPKVDLLLGTTSMVNNDNWSGTQISSVATALGAFPLAVGSKDAAVYIQLAPGAYTVHVKGNSTSAGVVLLEIYDADL
jgi:hypothetical protein